jgi:hypothetical protein
MSATALRWCAVPLGLIAFAARPALRLWWEPYTWRFNMVIELMLFFGGLLAAVAVSLGIFGLLSRGHRRGAGFTLREGGFVVQPSTVWAASQSIVMMFFAGGFLAIERVPNTDSMRFAEFGAGWIVSSTLVGIFVAAAVAFLVVQRPQLLLDREGLTIRRLRHHSRLAWEDLAPGGPLPPAKKRQSHMQLYRKPPPGYPHYVPTDAIPFAWLDIDPAYLAAAIRSYAEHPEYRAAIGTAEELDRLRSAGEVRVGEA